MKKILPIKFLHAHCARCGAYKTCDFTSIDECSSLLIEAREKDASIESKTENKPEKTRLERSLDRMDKLLDEQEKSIRRMCEILDRL